MLSKLKRFWRVVRRLSGDDAYERYLQHHVAHHQADTPLSKEAFFKRWQDEKWNGIKRCC
ncbi:MAG: YbdD/YjiX family protein [Methylobacter sp.]|jgi:uncharacterized short protein YbdD (DUF466 family)|nr:YbdD/YjiX family protein [Methylobacter sp.]